MNGLRVSMRDKERECVKGEMDKCVQKRTHIYVNMFVYMHQSGNDFRIGI